MSQNPLRRGLFQYAKSLSSEGPLISSPVSLCFLVSVTCILGPGAGGDLTQVLVLALPLHIQAPHQAGVGNRKPFESHQYQHLWESLLLWGGYPCSASLLSSPHPHCASLEGEVMSSCLRNALKMRITEHFPNSPQFTFSAFSLGCQAFVVIFINSDRWLLPFLPRTVPPPAGSDVILQLTALQAGLAPVSPDEIFSVALSCHCGAHPHCHLCVCNACWSVYSQAFVLTWLLLSFHKA